MQDLSTIQADLPRDRASVPDRREPFTHSHSREEGLAFLQQRVATFGLMFAILFGMFLVMRTVNVLRGDRSSVSFLPWQIASVAVFAGMWLVCRGRPRPYLFIRGLEFAGLNVAAGCAISMSPLGSSPTVAAPRCSDPERSRSAHLEVFGRRVRISGRRMRGRCKQRYASVPTHALGAKTQRASGSRSMAHHYARANRAPRCKARRPSRWISGCA